MRTPFYLGMSSPVLFASALRSVDTVLLRSMLGNVPAGKVNALDLRKQNLIQMELARRLTANYLCWTAVSITALSCMALAFWP